MSGRKNNRQIVKSKRLDSSFEIRTRRQPSKGVIGGRPHLEPPKDKLPDISPVIGYRGECRLCEKEFRGKTKQEVIDKCVAHKCKVAEAFRIRESLTPREREIMDKVMSE